MADTFSLATTGYSANSPFTPKPLTLGDAGGGLVGNQQGSMSDNAQILCKRPDGSTGWYIIDSSRYVPGQPPVLIAVGP
jgi:hypothetical protein